MTLWWLPPLAAVLTLGLAGLLRRYALRRLLDLPNARSSHAVPTPRGGGMAIVASFLFCLPALGLSGQADWALVWALLGGGTGIALLGFADDHAHIAARWRLLGHFACAAWVLGWLGTPPLPLPGVPPGWATTALVALGLVWLINLYNFMDGIDGIASFEAIAVCLGGALLQALSGAPAAGLVPLLLAGAVLGFVGWNFPVARMFMGDGGSGFLGLALGALALWAGQAEPALLWGWLILLGVFVVDATWTLLRRLLRGEPVQQAHRRHAYQFAARRFGRHAPVTLAVAGLTLGWLLPWALAVTAGGVPGPVGLVLAYLPLLALAVHFRAGTAEPG